MIECAGRPMHIWNHTGPRARVFHRGVVRRSRSESSACFRRAASPSQTATSDWAQCARQECRASAPTPGTSTSVHRQQHAPQAGCRQPGASAGHSGQAHPRSGKFRFFKLKVQPNTTQLPLRPGHSDSPSLTSLPLPSILRCGPVGTRGLHASRCRLLKQIAPELERSRSSSSESSIKGHVALTLKKLATYRRFG